MKRVLPALILIPALAAPLAPAPAHAAAASAPVRDEALARRLLHCANVAEFWAEVLQQRGDAQNAGNQVKVRDLFLAAAETVSDADFARREQPASIAGVKALVERQQKEKKDLLGPETASCSDTFRNQATPVLQQRAAAMAAPASAPASAASAAH